jgi:hypothetical protein
MVLQGFGVGFLDPLENFHDDGREAVGVEVDFLVVGDLAEVARADTSVIRSFCWFSRAVIWFAVPLLCWPGGTASNEKIGCEGVRGFLFDSPDIAEGSREVGSDGAAEKVDLFEGGHFVCVGCSDDFAFVAVK